MKSTLKYLLLSVASLILVGCGSDGNAFTIEGEFTGMKFAELFIYNPYDPTGTFDTIKVQEGKFVYRGVAETPASYVLLFPNAMEHIIFVGPQTEISYSAASNDLKNYSVKGSEENDLMMRFRNETSQLDHNKTKDIAARFIRENLNGIVAKHLFDRYFIQSNTVSKKETLALLKELSEANPDDELYITSKLKLDKFRFVSVGDRLPDVELTDRDNNSFSLWKGRKLTAESTSRDYTVIFAWATWMRNGYDYLWRLRQFAYDAKMKERVRFVGISLDNDRDRWSDLVRSDSLIIDHSCDQLGWNSPAVSKLGITDVPQLIVTDRTHTVTVITDDMDKVRDAIK